MVDFKSDQEIKTMAEGGNIAARVLHEVLREAEAGMTTLQLDGLAEKKINAYGGKPSFKGFEGYEFATCININEGVVHGIPNKRVVKNGDLLSLDLGVYYRGFHSDVSWTVIVGEESADTWSFSEKKGLGLKQAFLSCGREALDLATKQCYAGNHVGDISSVIQQTIEGRGFNVVRDLVGHGVGRELHEDPTIPCFGKAGQGVTLAEGMTIAVEIIYTQGSYNLAVEKDGWTIRTLDGKLGGLFERTLAVQASSPIVLTK